MENMPKLVKKGVDAAYNRCNEIMEGFTKDK